MQVKRCTECGKQREDLRCLTCDGVGLVERATVTDRCTRCDGRGHEVRCPDLLDHLAAELHRPRVLSHVTETPTAAAETKSPRARFARHGLPEDAVRRIRQAGRAADQSEKLHRRQMETHQRAVESQERMRQAPRNQNRMPRTKKQAAR